MSDTLGTYSFLPWLRNGLANRITASDLDPSVTLRASIDVALRLSGAGLDGSTLTHDFTKTVQLFGPGDVIGIDSRAVVKTEPRNWITNFEPNYLAYIDFYDEDFPWRYTPAAPAGARLRPWIALVVLAEDEFKDGANVKDRPLPYIDVANTNAFPPADQLWAWSHVHVNRSLAASDAEIVSTDMNAVLPKLQGVLEENPDLAYARVLCPRKLKENTPYHAFIVPSFESGRLAGLGRDPTLAPYATFSAWADYTSGAKTEPTFFPYYYRWYFRTGGAGDFEYLVRLLKPVPVDKRVGRRDLDVLAPGANMPGITDPALGGVLELGGALQVPRSSYTADELAEIDAYDHWAMPYPHPFQRALAALINLADDYDAKPADQANAASGLGTDIESDPDPLITPPLYGRWHALTSRLLFDRNGHPVSPNDNWVHELNLDPRYRVAAGLGTRVVQDGQEDYMNAAWEQVGQVLEANRRIQAALLMQAMTQRWYAQHLLPLQAVDDEKAFMLVAPLQRRVLFEGVTVHHALRASVVQPVAVSAPLRRVLRPGARLMRQLQSAPVGGAAPVTRSLLARINAQAVSAAWPKTTPPGVVTVAQVADRLLPAGVPAAVVGGLRRFPALPVLMLVVAALLIIAAFLALPFAGAIVVGAVIAGGAGALYNRLVQWRTAAQRADSLRGEQQTPAAVDALPHSPDFVVSVPGSGVTPHTGATDSAEAVRFKTALKGTSYVITVSPEVSTPPQRTVVDLARVSTGMITAIDPRVTIARRAYKQILLPGRYRTAPDDTLAPAMAYPVIDTPMYRPLIDLSADWFLPNINYIAENSITLLETNQKFIESYMVGINYEFARELLWREYPTDQRGSTFRQFWDVSSYFNTENLNDEQLKEKLRDIPPIDRWPVHSKLGDHDQRARGGQRAEVVLVIRGELLKKYPTAVIYAQRAQWQRKDNGDIDPAQERQLVPLSAGEDANPPTTKVRTPLYEAKADPDIYFFGFDLTVTEARGDSGERPGDDPGWFFVIKERPGEPRFGLDIERDGALNVWNDLAWPDVLPSGDGFIQFDNATPSLALTPPTDPGDAEKQPQYEEDKSVGWNKDASAADIAYVLFQAPVLVAVHAAEMLPRPTS